MQLRYLKNLLPAKDGIAKVTATAWSPNNAKLAVVSSDNVVLLFDEEGNKREQFRTKPGPSGSKNYVVRSLAWSPDSTRLAVAQSDNVVFVYKLASSPETAAEWGGKKTICNKFIASDSVTCMAWPVEFMQFIIFGQADGKVKAGVLKSNKSQTLYSAGSCACSISCSPDGSGFVTGHLDGKIYRFAFDDGKNASGHSVFARHSCAPTALTWAHDVVAAGPDKKVAVYDSRGRVAQTFDFSDVSGEREPTCAAGNPGGHSVAVAGYDRIRVLTYAPAKETWEAAAPKEVPDLYSVTALTWSLDGTRLVAGSLCGSVELFDYAMRRTQLRGKFEFTYVAPSLVIAHALDSGQRVFLKSHHNLEIRNISVLGDDKFVVAHTSDTLLLASLEASKLSEIPWRGSGQEKFFFDFRNVAMIFNAGELSLVEYGVDDILGSVRTEHVSPSQLSVRINDRVRIRDGEAVESKRIAYLIDLQTVAVLDLVLGETVATVAHDSRVDTLDLNETGRVLLFRDKRRHLHLYDIEAQSQTTLLNYCSFAQWVPGSDVVVAQNRGTCCVWYNIAHPEEKTSIQIKGDVEGVERYQEDDPDTGHPVSRTAVLVDEGVNTAAYTLDEGLITFGTAMDDQDYLAACSFLETCDMDPEYETMWKTLGDAALEAKEIHIAERAFAALGNVSKAQYLSRVNDLAETACGGEYDSPAVHAELVLLNKHFKLAESLLLEQGETDRAIDMYRSLHKWDEAIEVAEAKNHPRLGELRAAYDAYLATTHQEEKAGQLKEREGDLQGAINLFLKAGLPARAAIVITQHPQLANSSDVVERVAAALIAAGLEAKAGEVFELARMNQRALEAYRKGRAYRQARDLCRAAFPHEVVNQELAWADYLVSQKQVDAAINHYIEAGANEKACEAAIQSRLWNKAAHVVEVLDDDAARPFLGAIAKHYADAQNFAEAERLYVKGGFFREAIDMYIGASKWEDAHVLASKYMAPADVADMYVAQAGAFEAKRMYKDAEKLYMQVDQVDLAINMYKKAERHDDMIRLVRRHHPDLLAQTHRHLGQELEDKQRYSHAEQQYLAAGLWKDVVNMYRRHGMWEDAYRVSKSDGNVNAMKQVAYEWALSLTGSGGGGGGGGGGGAMVIDSAIKLLVKLDMVAAVIEIACDRGVASAGRDQASRESAQNSFRFALELSKAACKTKIPLVHEKRAMWLEELHLYHEAEEEFIEAGMPREAVLMHVQAQAWDDAARVAEHHDPTTMNLVLEAQGKKAFEAGDFQKGESLLLRAELPELAIDYYMGFDMWDDVMRLVGEFVPHKKEHYEELRRQRLGGGTPRPGDPRPVGNDDRLVSDVEQAAGRLEQAGRFDDAITEYLRVTASSSANAAALQRCWLRAVDLAVKFVPERAPQVTATVGERLAQIGQHAAAADVFLDADMPREAVVACMDGGQWDRAVAIADQHAPDMRATVAARRDEAERAAGLGRAANTDAELERLASRGDWRGCLRLAEKEGRAVLNKYEAVCAATLLKEHRALEALEVFSKWGAPANEANFNVYRRIFRDVAHMEDRRVGYAQWAALRQMLLSVATDLQRERHAAADEFATLTTVAHHCATRKACDGVGPLREIATKLTVSLLRHTDLLCADRAFYEAGMACNQVGWENMAFVFLNRYLDLSEAIEDGDLGGLDNTDFLDTDIPFEIPLPAEQFLDEAKREEVREYVLAISMDQKAEQTLDLDERGTYVGSLVDAKTGQRYSPCIVTGFPVLRNSVAFGGRAANKEDWNRFIMALKTSGSEELQDVMKFLAAWCGASESDGSYSF